MFKKGCRFTHVWISLGLPYKPITFFDTMPSLPNDTSGWAVITVLAAHLYTETISKKTATIFVVYDEMSVECSFPLGRVIIIYLLMMYTRIMYMVHVMCEVAFQYKVTKLYGNGVHSFLDNGCDWLEILKEGFYKKIRYIRLKHWSGFNNQQ